MANGSRKRPVNRKKPFKKDAAKETKSLRRVKGKKKQAHKNKTLLRQMRGMKWDEEEYSDEIEELDDVEKSS